MTTVIRMPAFTATMESGKLINWLVEEGAIVEKGQVIAEVETDKAIAEIESPLAGTVAEILVAAGDDDVDVETPLVKLETDGDTGEETSATEAEEGPEPGTSSPQPEPGKPDHPSKGTGTGERIPASPAARRVARDAGISLKDVEGTGPGGRITKEDVISHTNSAAATSPEASSMRRAIAKAMVQSKTSVPHFYTETNVVIDELARFKQELCDRNPDSHITWTTLLVHCVAKALADVKEARFRWEDGNVVYKDGCDIAVAVAIDDGVVAPVIRNADALEVPEIASKLSQLVTAARAGSLKQSDLGEASLTLSNLGMFSIDAFYPIVNMPEPLIIGVGRSRRMPVVIDDRVEIRSIITITQAIDHRVIDGAIAGRFADALCRYMEAPELSGAK